MSTSNPRRVNATDTEQDSFSQTLESYTSLVNDLLAESDVADDDDMDTIRDVSSQLIDEATKIEEGVKENKETVASTRREQAQIRSRVTDVEDDVEADETDENPVSDGQTSTGDGSNPPTQAPQTPLGDCVTLPETVAEQELTANIKRARDVASDVVDYGRSVPAGYAITSSELRTVLTAMNEGDGKAYTETVRRVMEYLDELGGDDVAVKETRGGQQTVIFDDDFVKRTVAWRQLASNDVVTEMGATG